MLTQALVNGHRSPGRYTDQHGLALVVVTPQRRHWQYRYRSNGRDRLMALGNADLITLAMARERHLEARAKLARGVDPLDERHAAKAPKAPPAPMRTFASAAKLYLAAHEPSWSNQQHRWQWKTTLEALAYPVIGDKAVNQITTDDILAVLEPVWTKTPETASRLRGRIERILDYAKARKWRQGENPALWRGNLAHLLPSPLRLQPVAHHAALPWKECPAFMATLLPQQGSMGALALALQIFTAARSGEVRLATWPEIDFESATWTVPSERMKARREHRVPLSGPALAILKPLAEYRQGSLIFPSPGNPEVPLSNVTLLAVLKRMGRTDITSHGFRASFRSWAQDLGEPADLAEVALAHVPASKVLAAYARSDMLEARRGLMQRWAAFLTKPPTEIVPLHPAAAA
jgi:integrase